MQKFEYLANKPIFVYLQPQNISEVFSIFHAQQETKVVDDIDGILEHLQ